MIVTELPHSVAGASPGHRSERIEPFRGAASRRAADPGAALGALVLAGVTLLLLLAPAIATHNPGEVSPDRRLAGPTREFPLGTDQLGRCLACRMLYGGRVSLASALAVTLLTLLIGVSLGVVAGYAAGWTDAIVMRVVDVLLALPTLLLALALAGTLGTGLPSVLLALVAVWWASYARIVRGIALALRRRPFVEAARAAGATTGHILSQHILPNVLPSVVVLATLDAGAVLLAVAALNFLGLGVNPPTPEWGAMLRDGRSFLASAPQLMFYPGTAITIVVLALNLVGDGLRDLLDPRAPDTQVRTPRWLMAARARP